MWTKRVVTLAQLGKMNFVLITENTLSVKNMIKHT